MGKGITGQSIILYEKTQVGTDAFKHPIYAETAVTVEDVLIGEPTTDDITTSTDLYGKKLVYTLGIPKGDTHDWKDVTVEFFGRKFKTFGIPVEGIEANIPLRWHKKVRVEAYE